MDQIDADNYDAAYRAPRFIHEDHSVADLMQRYVSEAGRILDIGCGTGHALSLAVSSQTCRWIGLDIQHAMLTAKAQRHRRLLAADAHDLGIRGESMDAVIATYGLLSHVDLGRVLAEIRRVMRPGGTAFLMAYSTRYIRRYKVLDVQRNGRGLAYADVSYEYRGGPLERQGGLMRATLYSPRYLARQVRAHLEVQGVFGTTMLFSHREPSRSSSPILMVDRVLAQLFPATSHSVIVVATKPRQ